MCISDRPIRPSICLRKMGCTCIECMPEDIKMQTECLIPKTPSEYAKASLVAQMTILEKSPTQFKAFYEWVLNGDSRNFGESYDCLLYTSPSPRDQRGSRMPSSA
eukprot:TRINITY_DN16082_c0_g1_i1.p2 TRINITY_DN16082_c0_g1~~TRINITY_DN16082_c0_g1_i1.p2  ORF type:complete len:118 (+),score=45.18 TRINITY_DN16082_c0_g1_i1:40-354(+)